MSGEWSELEDREIEVQRELRTRRNFWSMAALLMLGPIVLVGFGLAMHKSSDETRILAVSPIRPTPVFPSPVLAALDEAVQARFAVVPADGSFGMRRVVQMEPLTSSEKTALDALDKSSLQVAFYTAGRALVKTSGGGPVKYTGQRFVNMRGVAMMGAQTQIIKGGHGTYTGAWSPSGSLASFRLHPPDAPKPREISQHLTGTLENARVEAQRWKSGRWEIIAVPVPASAPSCVTCHNMQLQPNGIKTNFAPLKFGDTIGLAVYAYAPKNTAKTDK